MNKGKQTDDMLCPNCNREMTGLLSVPKQLFTILIPFSRYTLEIWDWNNEKVYCIGCAVEEANRQIEDIYYAGGEAGYEAGLIDESGGLFE